MSFLVFLFDLFLDLCMVFDVSFLLFKIRICTVANGLPAKCFYSSGGVGWLVLRCLDAVFCWWVVWSIMVCVCLSLMLCFSLSVCCVLLWYEFCVCCVAFY